MQLTNTLRGFPIVKFNDAYGYECSLQGSSSAMREAIWFGVDNPYVQVFVPNKGWQDVKLPKDTSIYGRMHLTREQVKELLPFLQRFTESGTLEDGG